MRRALALAAAGSSRGPNPRVGAVLLDPAGRLIGEGFHRGAGYPHAEIDALVSASAGGAVTAAGATAVVTLEPCAHIGRTGPCSRALVDAGVARVVFGQSDPNPAAAGGADQLRRAGVDVEAGVLEDQAARLNPYWAFAVPHRRPFVTWKFAASLDGRTAAADGTSQWISSPQSRADVHRLRSEVDAVMVGTGTVLADDPELTARPDGVAVPAADQPLRVVVGRRTLPATARVLDDAGPSVVITDRDPRAILARLHEREIRHVLLEGGPGLAAAFVRAGLVDEVIAYLAPVLLGAGSSALADAGIPTLANALRLQTPQVTASGPDIKLIAAVDRGKEG
jgi:diaminohydroxyphosphoribosylaminopyrimidine deaminase / 5-amino-6-(5-phosphoribosylamino)uracil reductase